MKNIFLKIRKILRLNCMHSHSLGYYYKIGSQFNDINSYLYLFNKCTKSYNLKTSVEICFSKSLKFGSTIKDVKKKLHKHRYQHFSNKVLNTEILLYRMLVGNYKVKIQFQFYNNKFFLYIYTFSHNNKSENEEIISILLSKYLSDQTIFANQIIIDKLNNCLSIENSIDLTIYRLSLDSEFFNQEIFPKLNVEELPKREDCIQVQESYQRL